MKRLSLWKVLIIAVTTFVIAIDEQALFAYEYPPCSHCREKILGDTWLIGAILLGGSAGAATGYAVGNQRGQDGRRGRRGPEGYTETNENDPLEITGSCELPDPERSDFLFVWEVFDPWKHLIQRGFSRESVHEYTFFRRESHEHKLTGNYTITFTLINAPENFKGGDALFKDIKLSNGKEKEEMTPLDGPENTYSFQAAFGPPKEEENQKE